MASTVLTEIRRHHTTRLAIDTVDALARPLTDNDPEQAIGVLEHATTIDPYKEAGTAIDTVTATNHIGTLDAIEWPGYTTTSRAGRLGTRR